MIREYEESDFADVTVLGRSINRDFIFKLNSVSKCCVYEEKNSVIGFIIVDIYEDRSEIVDVAVHINHRNKGIGSELMERVIDFCKKKGCSSISLEVKYNNVAAINLYNSFDFKVISVRKKYYDNGTVDAYLMFREL